jgi:hypothetical protein
MAESRDMYVVALTESAIRLHQNYSHLAQMYRATIAYLHLCM